MRQINNFADVKPSTGEFERPCAGGYVVEIINAVDVPMGANGKGDYLRIDYDIAEGEFAGYYAEQNKRFGGDWKQNFIRSYKESALGMFKHFINCLQESNPRFNWDACKWNEKAMIGLAVGIVLGEEEYVKRDGTVGTVLKVREIKTVQQIASGDFKIPNIKKLPDAQPRTANNPYFGQPANFEELKTDDDLPF